MYYLFCMIALSAVVVSGRSFAGDISHEVRKGTTRPDSGDGGYFEIGLGLVAYTSPFYGMPRYNREGDWHKEVFVDINARYQIKGFFFEAFAQSLDQVTIGYNFAGVDNWVFDWVLVQENDEMNAEEYPDYEGLNKRRFDALTGPRATGYLGKHILQFHALHDISGAHHGELYNLKLARHWQYRNWNFHGIIGANYRSKQMLNYYIGVAEDEASAQFPAWQARGGWAYTGELGATYPLSENWVFRGFIRRSELPARVHESPLTTSDHSEVIAASVSFVF